MPDCPVTVVLPCLNEAASLPGVLAAIPAGYRPLVVDNNSSDDTAEVARRHGADVVAEPRPGYGSAGHAGGGAGRRRIVGSGRTAGVGAGVGPRRRPGDRPPPPGTRPALALACPAGHR